MVVTEPRVPPGVIGRSSSWSVGGLWSTNRRSPVQPGGGEFQLFIDNFPADKTLSVPIVCIYLIRGYLMQHMT